MKQTLIHEIQLQNYLNIRNDEKPAFDNFKLKCSNVFLLFLQTLFTDFVILVLHIILLQIIILIHQNQFLIFYLLYQSSAKIQL